MKFMKIMQFMRPQYLARRRIQSHLSGRPAGEDENELARSGVTTFIYAGCDTLKVLSEALEAACA